MVRSASGHRAARRTAIVHFGVGGYNFTSTAATCPGEELGGAAILAIDVSKQRDFELLVKLSATEERVAKRNVEKGSIAPIFPNENAKVLCVDTKDTMSDNLDSQSVENPMLQGVVGSVSSSDSSNNSEGCGLEKDEDAELFLADRVVPSDDVEVMSCGAGGQDLELPVVKSGNEVDELRTERKSDISLEVPIINFIRTPSTHLYLCWPLSASPRDDFGESRKLVFFTCQIQAEGFNSRRAHTYKL